MFSYRGLSLKHKQFIGLGGGNKRGQNPLLCAFRTTKVIFMAVIPNALWRFHRALPAKLWTSVFRVGRGLLAESIALTSD